jgi:hypothetical protein
MGRDIGRGNHWDISLNGTSLTGGDIFSGDAFNRASPFAFAAGSGGSAVLSQVPVVIGDVLRLQITKTSSPGDYAGVNFTVTAACNAGDFNCNGAVDAADYVVWRKNPGGNYTPDDYTTWRTHFGHSFFNASGAGASGSDHAISPIVPEPATVLLLVFGTAVMCLSVRQFRAELQ